MKIEHRVRHEAGERIEYDTLVYETGDLPELESEEWTDEDRQKWLTAVLRKERADKKAARLAAIYDGTYEEHKHAKDLAQRMTMLRLLVKEVISLADYDTQLEIAGPKMIDSIFCRGFEKLRDNAREAYRAAQAEKRSLERTYADNGGVYDELRRLEQRMTGLEKQGRLFAACFETMLDVRPEVIAASGISWSSYNTLNQMASQRGQKRRMIDAKAEAVKAEKLYSETIGMSESEYRVWLAKRGGLVGGQYVARHNGIDAEIDAPAPKQAQLIELAQERQARDLRVRQEEDSALIIKTEERLLSRLSKKNLKAKKLSGFADLASFLKQEGRECIQEPSATFEDEAEDDAAGV